MEHIVTVILHVVFGLLHWLLLCWAILPLLFALQSCVLLYGSRCSRQKRTRQSFMKNWRSLCRISVVLLLQIKIIKWNSSYGNKSIEPGNLVLLPKCNIYHSHPQQKTMIVCSCESARSLKMCLCRSKWRIYYPSWRLSKLSMEIIPRNTSQAFVAGSYPPKELVCS